MIVPTLRARRYTQVRLDTDRAHRFAWACLPWRSASQMAQTVDSV